MPWSQGSIDSCSDRPSNRPPGGPGTGSATSARPRPTTPRSSPTASGWHISWGCAIREFRSTACSSTSRSLVPDLWPRRDDYNVFAIRWPAFGDVTGEGLLLQPGDAGVASVIVIPDADQSPEQLVGPVPGVPTESQVARRLAESGCRVIVPILIDRTVEPRNGRARLTNREFLYRPAFELGRHIIGYEVQKVLALVDWSRAGPARMPRPDRRLRLRRRRGDRALRRGTRPADRCGLRQRLFRRSQRRLDPADRP